MEIDRFLIYNNILYTRTLKYKLHIHTFYGKIPTSLIPTNYRLVIIHIVKPKRKYFRFSKCDASSIVAILGLLESWFSHLFMT